MFSLINNRFPDQPNYVGPVGVGRGPGSNTVDYMGGSPNRDYSNQGSYVDPETGQPISQAPGLPKNSIYNQPGGFGYNPNRNRGPAQPNVPIQTDFSNLPDPSGVTWNNPDNWVQNVPGRSDVFMFKNPQTGKVSYEQNMVFGNPETNFGQPGGGIQGQGGLSPLPSSGPFVPPGGGGVAQRVDENGMPVGQAGGPGSDDINYLPRGRGRGRFPGGYGGGFPGGYGGGQQGGGQQYGFGGYGGYAPFMLGGMGGFGGFGGGYNPYMGGLGGLFGGMGGQGFGYNPMMGGFGGFGGFTPMGYGGYGGMGGYGGFPAFY